MKYPGTGKIGALVDPQLGVLAEGGEDALAGRVGMKILHDEQLAARRQLLQLIHVRCDCPVQD